MISIVLATAGKNQKRELNSASALFSAGWYTIISSSVVLTLFENANFACSSLLFKKARCEIASPSPSQFERHVTKLWLVRWHFMQQCFPFLHRPLFPSLLQPLFRTSKLHCPLRPSMKNLWFLVDTRTLLVVEGFLQSEVRLWPLWQPPLVAFLVGEACPWWPWDQCAALSFPSP